MPSILGFTFHIYNRFYNNFSPSDFAKSAASDEIIVAKNNTTPSINPEWGDTTQFMRPSC